MAKGKGKSKFKPSSGLKATRDRQRRIMKLKIKIKRWERYKAKGKFVSKNAKDLSRYNWDTAGLKKQVVFLEKLR